MPEKAICNVCGKKVDLTMSFSIVGEKPTPPICNKCFKKATDIKLSQLKEEMKMPQTAKKDNVTQINPTEVIAYCPPTGQAGDLWHDPKVSKMVSEIIKKTPEFNWLSKYQILTVFKESLGKKGAKIRRATDYEQLMAPVDIILTIADENWKELSETQKLAILSHELCHTSQDENGDIVMVEHDFDGFSFEISKYGAWSNSLKTVAKQLEMFSQKHVISDSRNTLKSEKQETESEEKE